ncbi:MAG: sulfatase-like hydrolase/transferase [Verrucomicrobiaceae bacterium]|nr:sulfatase-like hydrolase/transferase [Verrucomicrobiaceae bacterium]
MRLHIPISLLAAIAFLCSPTVHATPPNVVLIVSDDQGYNDLGCLNPDIKTPNLDRLAKEGTRLSSFYVAWPACTPSRAAFLTGRYPQRNGISDMIRNEAPDFGYKYPPEEYEVSFERIGGMDERERILPALLKPAGYRSAIFGKWDLGSLKRYLPLQRGFDKFYGFVNTGIDYFTHERYGVPSMYRDNVPTNEDKGTYCTDLFGREALAFMESSGDQPFLLYLPFNAPHGSSALDPKIRGTVQAPDEYKAMYPPVEKEFMEKSRYGKKALTPTPEARQRDYRAALTCMDANIGRVLEWLDQHHKAENTLVIFFSDNGGSGGADNEPLRGHKSQMFEGGVRVPCIIRWPGHVPAGKVSDEFLTSLEVVPTILAATGATAPAGHKLDGHDMLPVIADGKPSPRDRMTWVRQGDQAVRWQHYKWIRTPKEEYLFDLEHDLGEKENLISSQPALLKQMRGLFDEWVTDMNQAEPRGPFRDF